MWRCAIERSLVQTLAGNTAAYRSALLSPRTGRTWHELWFGPPYAHNCDALRPDFVDIFVQWWWPEGIVSGQIPSLIRSIALVVATLPVLGMSIGTPVDAAHADDCLAAPNSPSPQGRHWYYRLDWATQRKCWYLRAPGHHSVSAPSRSIPAADSAPRPVRSGDADPASPDVKVVAVNPKIAPAITSTGDKSARRNCCAGTRVTPAAKLVIAVSRSGRRITCRCSLRGPIRRLWLLRTTTQKGRVPSAVSRATTARLQ